MTTLTICECCGNPVAVLIERDAEGYTHRMCVQPKSECLFGGKTLRSKIMEARCGHEIIAHYNPPLLPGRPASLICTCRVEGCPERYMTYEELLAAEPA